MKSRLNILNESNRMLSKLQLLSVFFGEDIIYKIYLRSQVAEVYKFVETNKYFSYSPSHELFVFCDINWIDWTNNLPKKEKLIYELNDKNDHWKAVPGQ